MSGPSRRDVLAGTGAALLTGCAAVPRPNVLVVLLDQLRASALSIHGETNVATPRMDAVLSGGTRCTHAFTANPICAPARASLWTGLHATAHRVRDNGYRLDVHHTTVAERLRQAGYRTGYIGKWHLYGKLNPGFVPPSDRFGFERWQAYNVSHRFRDSVWFEDDASPLRPSPPDTFEPEYQTDQALAFVREDQAGPWFLVVSYGPPHPPGIAPIGDWARHVPQTWLDAVDPAAITFQPNVPAWIQTENTETTLSDGAPDPGARAHLRGYYAQVLAMDALVGRLLDGVDAVAPDTLVVFAADHGEQGGSHGLYAKSQPYDESLRVPLGFRWPGIIPADGVIDAPISLIDVAPTVLDLVGARPLRHCHGISHADALLGGRAPRDHVLCEGNIDGRKAWFAVRSTRFTYVERRAVGAAPSLWDHRDDPFQMVDRAGDPGLAAEQQQLAERLTLARAMAAQGYG